MTAALADPAARVIGRCSYCKGQMVTQKDWAKFPQLREAGFLRHSAFGMCAVHYARANRAGTLPLPAPGTPSPRLPAITLQVSYKVTCAECDELTPVDDRRAARRVMREHRDTHRQSRTRTKETC